MDQSGKIRFYERTGSFFDCEGAIFSVELEQEYFDKIRTERLISDNEEMLEKMDFILKFDGYIGINQKGEARLVSNEEAKQILNSKKK